MMNAHQLDDDGVIINTIVVESLDVFPSLVDASIGGQRGDSVVNGAVIPKPLTKDEINAPILAQIAELEKQGEKPRRVREAVATEAGRLWMIALDAQIFNLRKTLVK